MYHIILNPAAGHGQSIERLTQLRSLFESDGRSHEVLTTHAPMDARAMAREACANGSEGIVAIGGDGTMQEVVTGMWEASGGAGRIATPLGIMPCGSGNDFSLTLEGGKRQKKNDREAVVSFYSHIAHNHTRTVDVPLAGGMAFLNVANIGLDARIVRNAAGLKKYFGHHAYIASAVKSIIQHKNVPLNIIANGETLTGDFTLLAVCNGQYYGGGMRIAPHAQIDDGQLTVCLVEGMPRAKTMVVFPSVIVEKHVGLKAVRFLQCDSLTVTLTGTESLCMDGNLYDYTGNITFTLLPKALRLFA